MEIFHPNVIQFLYTAIGIKPISILASRIPNPTQEIIEYDAAMGALMGTGISEEKARLYLQKLGKFPKIIYLEPLKSPLMQAALRRVQSNRQITIKKYKHRSNGLSYETLVIYNNSYCPSKVAEYFITRKRSPLKHPETLCRMAFEGIVLGYSDKSIKNFLQEQMMGRKLLVDCS